MLFLLPAAGAGYMTWLSWRAGDDGKWLFGVFTAFFLILGAAPFLAKAKRSPPPDQAPANTRFVPHWFMLIAMLVLLVLAVSIVLAIIRSILHP